MRSSTVDPAGLALTEHATRIAMDGANSVGAIVIRYCSSDVWIGNSSRVVRGARWEFRGAEIVRAVFETEVASSAVNFTLIGLSAGAIGAGAHASGAELPARYPGATWNVVLDSVPPMYGNFDIILVHPTRVCEPSTTPPVPCAVLCFVATLVGC